MATVDAFCRDSSQSNVVVNVEYSGAGSGNISGTITVLTPGPGGMKIVVDHFTATDTPSGGSGTLVFDCGAAGNFSSGTFTFDLAVVGAAPIPDQDFPPADCD